jgi:hypothetical protein
MKPTAWNELVAAFEELERISTETAEHENPPQPVK